ncbi:helix-turn-helix domain-containing protein [Anaerosolibacter sp.]|uniref:helix-turn-helix domain-containing protein n=1 Tax=Anaerosolibacter sp. TaxID=1872527 RepID=UPI0039EF3DBC
MYKIYDELGKKVRMRRKEKNYTTAELAERLGISAGLVNNIENAKYDVFRLELLLQITNELNVSLGELLQLNTLDVRNIEFNENFLPSIETQGEDTQEDIQFCNHQLNLVIRSFLTTISEYGITRENIETISNHILHEFDTLVKLHRLNTKIPS